MTHTRKRTAGRGYILIEIIVTLALIGVVASISTQLLFKILESSRALSTGEREALAADRAATALRLDVERSTAPTATDKTVTLHGVIWAVEGDALHRTHHGRTDRFGPLPGSADIKAMVDRVTLRIGDAEWTFAPLIESSGGRR